ncbi:ribonuclease HII [Sinanaerobacter chloroacetimidivorans]|uniref:ribonuclease HII n=1 Tax=Sinanaerobacter chloroacetimidivorans TaxID=2818044 RepID=UPI0029C9E1BF|nr:ribonuclease HII [Sinanaerobacter chloroacetimidivorans]
MKKEERELLARQKLLEMMAFEKELFARGIRYIAGVDEVGRGPLAGPVVAAAVILPEDFDVIGVDDSKKLSEKKREELFYIIKEKAIAYSVGMVDNKVIDEINILEATKLAMKRAVLALKPKAEYLLVDALTLKDVKLPQNGIIKGDCKSVSIAAASIIAKVTRDHMMKEFSKEFPYYAFEQNKGYGTKAHYKGLDDHGICPLHRKSFLDLPYLIDNAE